MSIEIDKLKQNNNELREIVNNSWDGIGIIDDTSKFIYINNAFSPILGYEKQEMLGLKFTNFMQEDFIQEFENLIEENKTNKYSNKMQVICLRKDKQKVYLDITVSLMLNKQFYVLNARDITKQISDDEILNKYALSNQFNLENKLLKVSDAFCYLSGYSKDELINKNLNEILDQKTSKEMLEQMLATLKQKNEWGGNIAFIKKDGSPLWVDAKIKPIYNKYGDITGYTSLMFDISQQLSLQNEIDTANTTIEQKDQILVQQSKLAIMGETLQMVSHQWRQPLNIISLKTQKLELDLSMDNKLSKDEVIQTLHEIKQESQRLSNVIEDFQSFINLKENIRLVTPQEVVDKAIQLYQSNPNDDIMITADLEDSLSFLSYPNELSSVFVNLLNNSKEAIKRNNIQHGEITIKQHSDSAFIYFEIIDNAGGINEDIIEHIFEPYFSTKESKHGVGLGLYMSQIIVNMHLKGNIEVKNNSKNGTTFLIKLPILHEGNQ